MSSDLDLVRRTLEFRRGRFTRLPGVIRRPGARVGPFRERAIPGAPEPGTPPIVIDPDIVEPIDPGDVEEAARRAPALKRIAQPRIAQDPNFAETFVPGEIVVPPVIQPQEPGTRPGIFCNPFTDPTCRFTIFDIFRIFFGRIFRTGPAIPPISPPVGVPPAPGPVPSFPSLPQPPIIQPTGPGLRELTLPSLPGVPRAPGLPPTIGGGGCRVVCDAEERDVAFIPTSGMGGGGIIGDIAGLVSAATPLVTSLVGGQRALPGGTPVQPAMTALPQLGLPFVDIVPQGRGDLLTKMISPFTTGPCPRSRNFVLPHPTTGNPVWFGPRGKPVLWSGDISACRRTRRVAARARRRSGGR